MKNKNSEELNDDIKIWILLGFTGPIKNFIGPMSESAQLALNEASN